MATNIVYNGVTYSIPATDDVDWGDAVTSFLVAIPDGMLTKLGGAWHLTGSDLDLGSAYGLVSLYLKSKSATLAQSGFIRLAKTDRICWRNNANGGDNYLTTALDWIQWNGVDLADISTAQTFTNKTMDAALNPLTNIKDVNIAADAAIAWSKILFDGDFGSTSVITAGGVKLGTTNKVTLTSDPAADYTLEFPDGDGTTGQALVKDSTGKLSWASVPGLSLSQYAVLVGDSSDLPVEMDTNSVGDIGADETTGLTIKLLTITDAMISATAAIDQSKLKALTASRALVTDGSGFIAAATTTAAEIGYVNGVTSAIQTQLGTKVAGPASAVADSIAVYDSTTGKLIKDGGSKISDLATTTSVAAKVTGPASAVGDDIAVFDSTTGKLIKDGGKKIADLATLAGAEVLTNKDIDGGTASNTSRLTVPKAATATLAGLTRKEATLVFDSTTKKLSIDDGSALKVVGGGLVVTVLDAPATSGVNLEAGKHYIVTGLTADTTLNLPAGASEAAWRVSVLGNKASGFRVTLHANGSDTIGWDGTTTYSDAKIVYPDTWVEGSWRTTYWAIDDASNPLTGTFSGPLTITGALTPSGGIVGKVDGVTVAAGYVGQSIAATSQAISSTAGQFPSTDNDSKFSFSFKKGIYLVHMMAAFAANNSATYIAAGLCTTRTNAVNTRVANIGNGPGSGWVNQQNSGTTDNCAIPLIPYLLTVTVDDTVYYPWIEAEDQTGLTITLTGTAIRII